MEGDSGIVIASFRNLLCGAVVVLALSGAASASTIVATFNGVAKGKDVRISTQYGSNGTWDTVTAGLFTFTEKDGGTFPLDPLGPNASILGFCIQLEQGIAKNATVTFDVVALEDGRTPPPAIGLTKAAQIDQLFSIAFASNSGLISSAISDLVAQAVQIAIWEIINETTGTYSTSGGSTRFSSSSMGNTLKNKVNEYLGQITANPTPVLDLYAMNNKYKQDFVIQVDNPGDVGEVPEPSTMLLSAAALLGIGLLRRTRTA